MIKKNMMGILILNKKYVDKYYPNYKYDEDKIEEWKSMVQTTKDETEKVFQNVAALVGKHFNTSRICVSSNEEKDLLNKLRTK